MRTCFGYKLDMDCNGHCTGQLKNSSRSGMKHVYYICISCMLHMAMQNRSYRKWTQWEEWQVAAVEQGSSASGTGVQFQVEQPWPHVPWNPRHTGHTVARVAHRAGAHGAERAKIPKGGRTGAEGEGAMPRWWWHNILNNSIQCLKCP